MQRGPRQLTQACWHPRHLSGPLAPPPLPLHLTYRPVPCPAASSWTCPARRPLPPSVAAPGTRFAELFSCWLLLFPQPTCAFSDRPSYRTKDPTSVSSDIIPVLELWGTTRCNTAEFSWLTGVEPLSLSHSRFLVSDRGPDSGKGCSQWQSRKDRHLEPIRRFLEC